MNSQNGQQGGYGVPLGYLAFPFGHQVSNEHYDGMSFCPFPRWTFPVQPNVGNPQSPPSLPGFPSTGPTSSENW